MTTKQQEQRNKTLKMKKTYSAPQMKVVEIKNDVIATSPTSVNNQRGFGTIGGFIQERGSWDEDFEEDEL